MDHGVRDGRIRSKTSSQSPVPSCLTRELRLGPTREMFRQPDPMLSQLGNLDRFYLCLGGGSCVV